MKIGKGDPVKISKVLETALGAARKNPDAAPKIYRQAAHALGEAARDPKNAHIAKRLSDMALTLAGAAMQHQAPPQITISDFQDILQETQEAFEEVGDDTLDLYARRRQIHDERTVDDPRVSIAPESFNRDATLGRAAILKWNPTVEEKNQGITQSQTLAFWQGTKKEAQALTVDCGVELTYTQPITGALPAAYDSRCYGIVEYGSDGYRSTAKFDVGFGTRFTIVGNYCSVILGMDEPGPTNLAATILAGVSIGTFAAPSASPVTCTAYIDGLVAGGVAFVRRPLKATAILNLQTDLTAGVTTLAVHPFDGGGLPISITEWANQGNHLPVPLSPDAGFVRVTNNEANPGNFRLLFQLGL